MIDHDELLQDARNLEPLSKTASSLTRLFANEDWAADDVIEIISFDAALTARLLRIANSAAAGGAVPIATLRDAVMRVGAAVVIRTAVGTSIRGVLDEPIPSIGLEPGDLWRHSVAAAAVTDVLPLVTHKKVPPEAFTAALLHDLGRIVMHKHVDASLVRSIDEAVAGGVPRLTAEIDLLGVHHGEIGALIAQSWQLPEVLIDAIAHHHDPHDPLKSQNDREVCDVVTIADAGARQIGFLCGESGVEQDEIDSALERLGLTAVEFTEVCELALERFTEILEQFE